MGNFCILRIKKLHSNANVGGALSHHLRTRQTDNADPERMKLNVYEPKPENFNVNYDEETRKRIQQKSMAMYKNLLPEKIRKNAVRCVELMMTFSPEVRKRKDFSPYRYLSACENWAKEKFGYKNFFFSGIHMDETTPHISLLFVPKDEKGQLNARKLFGGRDKMTALQDDFYRKVGQQFYLDRGLKGSKAKHQDIQKFYENTKKLSDFEKLEQENSELKRYRAESYELKKTVAEYEAEKEAMTSLKRKWNSPTELRNRLRTLENQRSWDR